MIRRLQKVPDWLWLILIASAVRLITLGAESLWYDESFTSHLSQLSFANMWRAILGDVHPPAWYIVSWVIGRVLGNSDFALRLPAALLSVSSVLLVRKIALAVKFDRRSAFVAGLLAAILPASVYYGQDARMYPMLCCFVLGATLAGIKQRWRWFTVCAVGASYTQNLGVLYIVVLGSVLLIMNMRHTKQALRIVSALSGVVIVWLPWFAGGMLHQLQQISQGFWIPPLTAGAALYPLSILTFGARLPGMLQVIFAGVAVGWTFTGLIACRRWILTRTGIIITAVTFGTPVLAAVISVLWRSIYLPRAFLPSSLLLCLFWAWPLAHLSRPNRRTLQAVAVPTLIVTIIFYYVPAYARVDIRAYADIIREGYKPGDVVFFPSVDGAILFTHYLPDLPYRLMPESNDLNQSLTDETKAAMQFSIGEFSDLEQQYRRVWIVVAINPLTSVREAAEVARIEKTYCYQLVWQSKQSISRVAIELVDLQCLI